GIIENIEKTVSMYAKKPGDLVYIVGNTYQELGGSHYYNLFDHLGNECPKVFADKAKLIFDSLSCSVDSGLISAMHDCSEGGLGVACSEMAFSGDLGMDIFLSEVPYENPSSTIHNPPSKRNDFILFSQSNSRFIVEIRKKDQKAFEKMISKVPFGLIGCISRDKDLKVRGLDGKICLKAKINELKNAWQKPMRW
ncbi:MAG: phosphoribosylformylglycinamidine synthase, partial [Candidatus Omnitrophica bacterium]|nr:phosphoribosylformylglycinamidine synthase [Candidatus Omnitrophota bacterium]